ncbi:MAG: hypothetical protein JSS95_01885 [Acidobacteria bacterium]|nr:hypothetical protein [Acidobacteriota bacterium]
MPRTRSILLHGLGLALRRLPAFLWTYLFSLVLALGFCYPLKIGLSNILDHSLAAQRLSSGFDVGTAVDAAMRVHEGPAGQALALTSHGAVPAYLLLYLLLVPGTLFCYITRTRAHLSTLLRQGVIYFWRFVRIALLTLLAALFLLGPFVVLQGHWSALIDDNFVGRTSLLLRLAGMLVVLLAASLLRLYFDLVEAYTVQLAVEHERNSRPDRRVRRTLEPAFRLLRQHFFRAWLVFLLLAIMGAAAAFFSARTAMHMLAQPHAWPMFLVSQLGLMAMLFTRFWQRGAEVSLVIQHPLPFLRERPAIPFAARSAKPATQPPAPPPLPDRPHHIEMIYNPDPLTPLYPAPLSTDDTLTRATAGEQTANMPDPIPNPEPAAPSLDEPDPGVFHHDPQKPPG